MFVRAGAVFSFFSSLSSVLNHKSTEDAVWVETSARELFKGWNTWIDALWVKSGNLNHRCCNGSLKAGSQTNPVCGRVSFHLLPCVRHMSKKWRKRGRGSQNKGLGWGFRHISSGVQTGVLVQIQNWISNLERTWTLPYSRNSEFRRKNYCFNHLVWLKWDFNRAAQVQFCSETEVNVILYPHSNFAANKRNQRMKEIVVCWLENKTNHLTFPLLLLWKLIFFQLTSLTSDTKAHHHA